VPDSDRATWSAPDRRDPRPPATNADAARETAWRVVRWGSFAVALGVAGLMFFVVLGLVAYRALGIGGGDFVVRNKSGVTLHDLALTAVPGRDETRRWTIKEIAQIAPGEAVEASFSNSRNFTLRVGFSTPEGRQIFDDVVYIDSDEGGDVGVTIDAQLRVNGKSAK